MKEYDFVKIEKMWKYNAKIIDRWFDLFLLLLVVVGVVWFAWEVVAYWIMPYVPTIPIKAIM